MSRPLRRFAFKLAGHLKMTVGELLARVSSEELSEWLAYDRLDPIPDSYWQAGLVAATVANAMGGGKGRRFRPEDFMPRSRAPKPAQSAAEGMARMAVFRNTHNARVKAQGG